MRRLVLGFAFLGLLSALVACQGPCYNCNGGRSTLFMGKHRAAMGSDIDEQPVFLAKSAWEVGYVSERFPKVRFERSKERA